MSDNKPLALLQREEIAQVSRSLQRMSCSQYPDFVRWVLREPHHRYRWLQLTGLTAINRLVTTLLSGLFTPEQWRLLSIPLARMTVYQMYEVISDNLATGLAYSSEGNAHTYPETRRELLGAFNTAVCARLDGADPARVRALLSAYARTAGTISLFQQSLDSQEHRALVSGYLACHPGADVHQIEFAVLANLHANLELCAEQVEVFMDHPLHNLLRGGLRRRYAGVSDLLTDRAQSPQKLMDIGSDTILVVPTLTYTIGVTSTVLDRSPPDPSVLQQPANDAALLVRLLNDCGTQLLEDPAARGALTRTLRRLALDHPDADLSWLLLHSPGASQGLLSRIRKDLLFGEFNIALDGISGLTTTHDVIGTFTDRLDLYASHYQQRSRSLSEHADALDTVSGCIITRFVDHHRTLYARPFTSIDGEYAIHHPPRGHHCVGRPHTPAGRADAPSQHSDTTAQVQPCRIPVPSGR